LVVVVVEMKAKVTSGITQLQAQVRGFIQRQRYEKRVRNEAYRAKVANEILLSEKIYYDSLHALIHV
jgi:hypothetical protein